MSRSKDILETLVGFDTVSHRSNLPLIEWVAGYLQEHGIGSRRVTDDTGEKATLIATLGPPDVPGIVLSGHTDVVPVEGQDWATDPFALTERDGRLYGRGSTDMKGFVACALAAVPALAMADLALPVHLVLSYDEEVGCIGVRPALRDMAGWAVKPRACIVGEPTGMRVVLGHKAKRNLRVRVRGSSGHSSLAPRFANAAQAAARLVSHVADLADHYAAEGARDDLYDLPHTTLHVGVLRGGTQLNIVPEEARIDFEVRAIGADDIVAIVADIERHARETLEPALRAVDPAAGFSFEVTADTPGLDTDEDAEVVQLAKGLGGGNDVAKVAFGTEGGLFEAIAGVPTVICGPGDIGRAHKADEWVGRDELAACDAFLARLVERCEAGW